MPPPTRPRAPPQHVQHQDETDSEPDVRASDPNELDDEDMDDQLVGAEDEDDLSENAEGDALASPHPPSPVALNLSPPPPYLREISTLASWTVSSSKPGCSIPQLRDPSPNLFWQSDGPQPHYLNIHFFKLVRIVGLRLYLDFEQDESYTPTRIVFLAGSGMNDLVEWGEMKLESPRGWVWADFSGVGDPDSDDDEDEGDGDGIGARLMLGSAGGANGSGTQANDASSDSENIPQPRMRQNDEDTMLTTPHQQQPQQQQTPQNQHQIQHQQHTHDLRHTATPIFPTPSMPPPRASRPRIPFASLSPNPQPTSALAPAALAPKMPVLRAHLVQIKILENHQNGKDTHLRGLQIFARNDEVESEVARKGRLGGGGDGRGGKGKGIGQEGRRRMRGKEFDELGGGFREGGELR